MSLWEVLLGGSPLAGGDTAFTGRPVLSGTAAGLAVWELWENGFMRVNSLGAMVEGADQSIADNGTIALDGALVTLIHPSTGAAKTGAIMAKGGTLNFFRLLVNTNQTIANSITFAAAGTSNVSSGVAAVVPGANSQLMYWSASLQLWVPVA